MEQYYLGFDAGTQSVKTAVYDIDMNLIVQDTNATILNYPHPGWVEMDADQYLHATVTGIRNCVTKMKEKNLDPDNIRSIFGDGIICGIVGVDKDCHAITPYINYLDSRTKEDVEELASHHYEIWAKETGNPQPNCMFPAMFARWMMKNCEGFKEKGRKFMHNAPYILANLAGLSAEDAFIDWGTMSGWGLGYRVTEKKMVQRTIRDPWNSNGNDAKDSKTMGYHWNIIRDICKRNRIETRNPNLCGSRRYDAVYDRMRSDQTRSGSRRSRNMCDVLYRNRWDQ